MQIPADAPLQAPAIPDISTVDVPTYTAPGPQPSSASVPGEFLYTFRLWGQQVTASSAHISNLEALAQPLEACPLPSSANLADALPPLHPWMSGSLLSGVATSDTAYSAVEELAADISYLTDPDPRGSLCLRAAAADRSAGLALAAFPADHRRGKRAASPCLAGGQLRHRPTSHAGLPVPSCPDHRPLSLDHRRTAHCPPRGLLIVADLDASV